MRVPFALAVTCVLLAGCSFSGSSSTASWTGGSGDFELHGDCGGSIEFSFTNSATAGQVYIVVLHGGGEPAAVYDMADDDLRDVSQRLTGPAGNWSVGGFYSDMDGAGKVRMAC